MAEWLAVISITLFAVISPGPDFAMVSRNSLVVSRRAGLLTAFGIGLGVVIHVSYTLIGIGVLIETSAFLFSLMKFAGAAYLGFLGYRLLRSEPEDQTNSEPAALMTDYKAFRIGLLTNVLNPKTMIFIVSLFLQVVEPTTALSTRIGYGVFASVAHIMWFSLVALFFAVPAIRQRIMGFKHWVERAFGVVLIFFGAVLIVHQNSR